VWFINDNSGNVTTCTVTVVVNDLLPTLTCPAPIVEDADFNQAYASGIVVPLPIYNDNCDSTSTWTMSGATVRTVGDTIAPYFYAVHSPDTFNVGVTTIEYTYEDKHGHVVTCDFTITVTGPPDIECPPDTTIWLDGNEGICAATFDPGTADLIEGIPPITWTYTITFPDGSTQTDTYTNPAPGYADPLGNIDFPLGVTTIQWHAENISGEDTCSHWIEVIDTIPPTFTAAEYENCVDRINFAIYNPTKPNPVYGFDPNLEKDPSPDYHTFTIGNTSLDLLSLEDNCCDSIDMTIHWRIEFTDILDPTTLLGTYISPPDIVGTGQPSTYGSEIQLWGDGATFTNVTHNIFYWVEDCNGNITPEIREEITITPRPEIIKTN